jgi:predicted transposase YbfD/YdcC
LPKKPFEAAVAANARLIVQLKDNQPTLREKIEGACGVARPLSIVQTIDEKQRNRHETRTIGVFDAAPAVADTEWAGLVVAAIQVERVVNAFNPATGSWKRSEETSFYLSSRAVEAKLAATAIREHWGIENKSHYTRDVTFREDASRIRKNSGIFARLLSQGYNILRTNQSGIIAQDRYAAALGGLERVLAMRFG